MSSCFFNASKDRTPNTSLGSPFQHLLIFSVKKFPLMSNLNLLWHNLRLFPAGGNWEKRLQWWHWCEGPAEMLDLQKEQQDEARIKHDRAGSWQRGGRKSCLSFPPSLVATFGGHGAAPGWQHCGKMAPRSLTRSGCGEHVGLEDTSET